MTSMVERGHAFCRCDVCGADSEEITNTDQVRAQRVAINFYGWRVFKLNGVWQHSCARCVANWREGLKP